MPSFKFIDEVMFLFTNNYLLITNIAISQYLKQYE